MLTRIDLRHFKCFETLKLPLCPLTLLSGANSSGKSSALQALVLLHQTMREHEWSSRLMLNGDTVRLGTAADVIDQVHGREGFGIALLDGDGRFQWEFEGERDEMSVAVTGASGETDDGAVREADGTGPLRYLLPAPLDGPGARLTDRLRRLTYLTAERLGPREHYAFYDRQLTPVVGPRGQHAASVLHSRRDDRVLGGLLSPDAVRMSPNAVRRTLFPQVEAGMRRFFPGCELTIERVPRANSVTLGIRPSEEAEVLRPVHVGFGVTQVLPIVVAVMSAGEDDLLLIENPEIHLHPAGQAEMGMFLAQAAAAGAQVVIETHSDHVLNGIRRAVKAGVTKPDDVALHFFRPRQGNGGEQAQVVSPSLDDDGNVDEWPGGFFDQFDKDMTHFAGWS